MHWVELRWVDGGSRNGKERSAEVVVLPDGYGCLPNQVTYEGRLFEFRGRFEFKLQFGEWLRIYEHCGFDPGPPPARTHPDACVPWAALAYEEPSDATE